MPHPAAPEHAVLWHRARAADRPRRPCPRTRADAAATAQSTREHARPRSTAQTRDDVDTPGDRGGHRRARQPGALGRTQARRGHGAGFDQRAGAGQVPRRQRRRLAQPHHRRGHLAHRRRRRPEGQRARPGPGVHADHVQRPHPGHRRRRPRFRLRRAAGRRDQRRRRDQGRAGLADRRRRSAAWSTCARPVPSTRSGPARRSCAWKAIATRCPNSTGSKFSAAYSNTFADDTIGVLLGVVYAERKDRTDVAGNDGGWTRNPDPNDRELAVRQRLGRQHRPQRQRRAGSGGIRPDRPGPVPRRLDPRREEAQGLLRQVRVASQRQRAHRGRWPEDPPGFAAGVLPAVLLPAVRAGPLVRHRQCRTASSPASPWTTPIRSCGSIRSCSTRPNIAWSTPTCTASTASGRRPTT